MVRIAIQVKELIASNISSALDGASNPAKMLAHLQREIEDALLGLTGELARARRHHSRLEAGLALTRGQEDNWADKAKIAIDHGREDLARQALLAREDCRARSAGEEQDIQRLAAQITDMESAQRELEAKRDNVRQRRADLKPAAEKSAASATRTDKRMDHLDALEKRTALASEDSCAKAENASVEREIEDLQRARKIEEELAALREEAAGASTGKPAKKRAKRTKAG